MKLHDLKPAKGSTKARTRVGRGKAAVNMRVVVWGSVPTLKVDSFR
jgi:hypothetical protein